MNSIVLLDKVSKISLYLLVFLLPVWFLPFTQNMLDYQKQVLLIVMVFVGFTAWLGGIVSRHEFSFRTSVLHIPVALLVLVLGFSTIFSLWRYGSLWGWPLDVAESFLTFFAFALLYVLISQTIQSSRQLFFLYFFLIISGVVAGLFALLQLFGIFLLPFDFAKITFFNTIGTINSVAVGAAILLPLTLTLAFVSHLLLRPLMWIGALVLLIVLMLVNFLPAWIVLIAGLFVLFAFGTMNVKKRGQFGWVSLPMVLIVLALFFMIFRITIPGAPATPVEVSPSQGAEFEIIKQVFQERALLGSGPGTFVFDYVKFHSPVLNQTIFWGTRFTSGASEILDFIATKGLVGIITFLVLLGTALWLGVKNLLQLGKEQQEKQSASTALNFSWMLGLGTLASLVSFLAAYLLYPANIMIWFFFWVLLGGLGVFTGAKLRTISITSPALALVGSFLFLVVTMFGVGLLFVGGQKYAAEVQYLDGVRKSQQGDIDQAITKIISGATLNPSMDVYWRDLSQLYLARVNQIATDKGLSDEQKQQQSQVAVGNAVAAARQAVRVSPSNVANWNVQGFVYRNLIGIPGAENFAISSYEKATQLEPASPFSWTELGRVYLLQAQRLRNQEDTEEQQQEAFDKALENLNKATELKEDYAPAHYLIAVVYTQQDNIEEAIAKLEETKVVAPNDIGLAFQLGVMYWQQEELEKAQIEFERVKGINPNYSNARYMLGLVYDKQGEQEKAKDEFLVVASLNPDNEEVPQILTNLRSGRPALTGITPSQPPIEEAPPEISDRIEGEPGAEEETAE